MTPIPPAVPDVTGWRAQARCAQPGVAAEWFWSSRGSLGRFHAAELCAACPVQDPCLIDALTVELALAASAHRGTDHGYRGGMSSADRRTVRRWLTARPDLAGDLATALPGLRRAIRRRRRQLLDKEIPRMTPVQALATNALLRHLLDVPDPFGHVVTHAEARAAGALLARAARQMTYNGITEEELTANWPARPDPDRPVSGPGRPVETPAGWTCPQCLRTQVQAFRWAWKDADGTIDTEPIITCGDCHRKWFSLRLPPGAPRPVDWDDDD